jgi:SAM-dependent methyltransferase
MNLIEYIHDKYVHKWRVQILTEHLTKLLPHQDARVLDVGCGDGLLSSQISRKYPDLEVRGIDVSIRDETFIPVEKFDGQTIPAEDLTYDVVMFVDVLHHADDPMALLSEAKRVARHAVLIKDHTLEGILAALRLRLMDWVGNSRHRVMLPYNYWSRERWLAVLDQLNLSIDYWDGRVLLYPPPIGWFCGCSLHFIARLLQNRDGKQPGLKGRIIAR